MSKAVVLQIADAIVKEFEGDWFEKPVNATREYQPRCEVADLETLRVTVVPSESARSSAARNYDQVDQWIDVAIRKRIDPSNKETLDSLIKLAEDTARYFKRNRLADYDDASCVETLIPMLYDPEELEQRRVFLTVVQLHYKTVE